MGGKQQVRSLRKMLIVNHHKGEVVGVARMRLHKTKLCPTQSGLSRHMLTENELH